MGPTLHVTLSRFELEAIFAHVYISAKHLRAAKEFFQAIHASASSIGGAPFETGRGNGRQGGGRC